MSSSRSNIPKMMERAAIRKIIDSIQTESIQTQDKTSKAHIGIYKDRDSNGKYKKNWYTVEFIKIDDLDKEKIKIIGTEKIEIVSNVINDLRKKINDLINKGEVEIEIKYNNGKITKCDTSGQPGCYPVQITRQDCIDYVSEDFFLNLHHLAYELDMLVDLFSMLYPSEIFSMLYPCKISQQQRDTIKNAVIESFRIHLRIFLKFFDGSSYFDEALCRDYVEGLNYILKDAPNYNVKLPEEICDITKGTILTPEESDLLEVKLNLATAHLSYIRSEVDKDIREPGDKEVLDAMESICKKMDEFYTNTQQHLQDLFKQSSLDNRLGDNSYYEKLAKRATNLPTNLPRNYTEVLKNLQQSIDRLKSYLCENWKMCCNSTKSYAKTGEGDVIQQNPNFESQPINNTLQDINTSSGHSTTFQSTLK
ncbi:MAG: hypothetical protein TQ35_0009160 [Candidatus Aramenus sulfurataquae]|jgi:hypothetical protein|uniref:Uncharacterized protein n=1 Tax=Candidatus Aramenus sulfurataquae TaxID=1326980 RepID=A0ACC6TRF1_9CREN